MDSGKLFLGGITSGTTEENLKEYFARKYGQVKDIVIIKSAITG
ncbi:hypothetical protein, partial [Serratia marcescens]